MIMDVADLRRALDGLEDGLQVVAWDNDNENATVDVIDAFYRTHATLKRGFVFIVTSPEAAALKERVHELTAEVDDLRDEIQELEEQLDEAKQPK